MSGDNAAQTRRCQYYELADRAFIVTGGANGIGRAIATELSECGGRVAVLDKAAPPQPNPAHLYVPCDVRSSANVHEAVAQAARCLGPPFGVVHAAGVMRPATASGVSDADWAEVFAVNATGLMHVGRSVAPQLKHQRTGRLIAIASNAGRVPREAFAAYCASKAAAIMYTKCLGLELAPYGVSANVVSPGATDTQMQRALWDEDDGGKRIVQGDLLAHRLGIPLGQLAQPADVAALVLFLLSDRAAHLCMQDVCIDGGATLGAS